MKWNVSALAALFLLAGCGAASGGYANYAPESAGSQGTIGAQAWGGDTGQRPPSDNGPPPGGQYQQQQGGYERPDVYQADLNAPGSGTTYPQPGQQYQQYVPPTQQQTRQQQQTPPPPQQAGGTYQDPTANASGPAASSGRGQGRLDEVGYAGVRGVAGGDTGAVVAIHRTLPAGSFVEITNLENGRTILALVTGSMGPGADHPIDLSPAAARLLGATSATVAVRVRTITPTAPDQVALRAGQPAGERPDTPPVLLNALRKQLPAMASTPPASTPPPSYGRPAAGPVRTAGGAGFYVQVGAFSNATNAQNLARSLGASVRPGGGLHRVQLGPYRSAGEAEAARADVARRGYGDARVISQN